MKQNWSRKELEAFGEPLGDSVTQRKLGGGYICGGGGKGGGGGGAAPSQQTVTQTSIPEYAQPYVERLLGKSEALTDINQNPYQAYGGQRIASFSPLQQQAFANVASQTTAQQLQPATQFATQAGLGSLGVSGQAAGAGQRYEQMATNPYATQAYMSPYIQAALQPTLQEMQRQYGITGAQEQSQATGMGAFGGSREALMRAENERNKNMAMNQAIGQGYQNAFQAAQQAQQFGAGLGLQGYGTALQGLGQAGQAAGTLGQLGQTQFGQQQAISQEQQKVGAVQQAQAQQALDLAYQDFLKQRNYPYQQMAFMSDMLRGMPLSQSAQQIYTAPPSLTSQLGGLGMAGLGIYGMSGGFRGAKGGLMAAKEYKKGGLTYAAGGDISMMSTQQLMQMLDNPELNPLEVALIEKQLMLRRRMENNPESEKIMQMSGITNIPTNDLVPLEGMAGGGIVAFAKGGKPVQDDESYYSQYERQLMENIKKRQAAMETADPFAESRAREAKIQEGLEDIKRTSPWEALAAAGFATASGQSRYPLQNIGAGGEAAMRTMAGSKREEDRLNQLLLQQGVEREKSKFARETALLGSEQTALGQFLARKAASENARAARAAAGVGRASIDMQRAQNAYTSLFNNAYDNLTKTARPDHPNYKRYKNNPEAITRDARRIALNELSPQFRDTLGFILPKNPVEDGDETVIPSGGKSTAAPSSFDVIVDGKAYTFPTKDAANTFRQKVKTQNPDATIQ